MRLAASLLILALVLGMFWVLTLWRAALREAAALRDYPPEGQFVTVHGVRMHAVVRGAGPDLVLIHGASGSSRDFTFRFIDRLTDRYRVIAVDRAGFGWSDPSPVSAGIHEDARLLRAVAAELGAARPVVLGHSYGGAVALAWAIDAPDTVSALVLVAAPSHSWDTGLPPLYAVTSAPVLRRIAVPMIAAWVPHGTVTAAMADVFAPQPIPDGYAAAFGPQMSLRRPVLYLNARQRAGLKQDIRVMIPSYPALRVPIEAVHGDADTTVGLHIHADRLARDAPGDRLTVLPGIGHMPHHVAAAAVAAAIDRAAARTVK